MYVYVVSTLLIHMMQLHIIMSVTHSHDAITHYYVNQDEKLRAECAKREQDSSVTPAETKAKNEVRVQCSVIEILLIMNSLPIQSFRP
jgi:hypothetical protein